MAIGHDSASGEYNNTSAADTIRFRSTYCHDSRNPTLHLNLSYSLLLRKKKMILLVGVSQLTPKLEQVVNYVDPAAELLTLLSLGVLLPHITPQLPHASP